MRRYFHKLGFQMRSQNQGFMRLSREHRGSWLDLYMTAGNDESECGYIPLGDKKKTTFDEVVQFLCIGDDKRKSHYNKISKDLLQVGALEITPAGYVRIGQYVEEQQLGRTDDTNSKRKERERKFEERVARVRRRLTSYVKSDQGPGLDTFIRWICLKVRCKRSTAQKVLDALEKDRVIVVDQKEAVFSVLTLGVLAASPLAPPTEAVTETEAVLDRSCRTSQVESDSDSDSDSDSYESQLNSTEHPPVNNSPSASLSPDSGRAEGGASGEAAPVGCGSASHAAHEGKPARGMLPSRSAMVSGPPYPCDLEPHRVHVWEKDPELCAEYFCPDGDRDTWKVIRNKLKRHGEELFRQILREMQTDIASGDWKTMKSHARVFISKFKRYEH